jgi:O-antigen ligase
MTSISSQLAEVATRPASRTLSAARVLLGLTLAAAPLPFGAVYTWAWASITIATLLILLLWMVGSIGEEKLRVSYSPLLFPPALFLAWGLIQLRFHLTLTPVATEESVLKLATYLILYFVVMQLLADAPIETWRRLGIAVLFFGFIFSFLSILQFFWNPVRILWVDHDLITPFGSYVDRDHFAGLMEMVSPISAAYVLSRPQRDPLKGILWFGVLIPIVALLLTGSRGGFVAMLGEIVILGWILIWRNPLPERRVRAAATGLALVGVGALFLWLVPSFILTKLGTVNSYVAETHVGRISLWRNSLGIFLSHPLTGAGLGSFVTVYPAFEREPQELITEHAHNDYLEALTETGVVGGILILASLILFIPAVFRNLESKLRSEQGWIRMGAALACFGLLIHSFVDFNLQIPANAAWFAFCAGLASLSRRPVSRRGEMNAAGNSKPRFV